ncbi:hypothetical protein ACFL54_03020 [Planctomycetota bacterium]
MSERASRIAVNGNPTIVINSKVSRKAMTCAEVAKSCIAHRL